MKYSEMTPLQRKILLETEDSYPLRVRFLNKVGILTMGQVQFLKEREVDFDVDDRLAAAVLGEYAVEQALTQRTVHLVTEEIRETVHETVETILPPPRQRQLREAEGEAVGGIAGAFAALLRLIRRVLRL